MCSPILSGFCFGACQPWVMKSLIWATVEGEIKLQKQVESIKFHYISDIKGCEDGNSCGAQNRTRQKQCCCPLLHLRWQSVWIPRQSYIHTTVINVVSHGYIWCPQYPFNFCHEVICFSKISAAVSIFDFCSSDNAQKALCLLLEVFAAACQSLQIQIGEWRTSTSCCKLIYFYISIKSEFSLKFDHAHKCPYVLKIKFSNMQSQTKLY